MKTMKPELVTAYALAYHTWTVVPHQVEANFADMRACGFNAVALSYAETDDFYAFHTTQLLVKLAHRHDLKVLIVPSRVGGRFAGAPLTPSLFLMKHPECVEPGPVGFTGPLGCLYSEPFRRFLREFTRTVMQDLGADGIIWDEPKGTDSGSTHPDTRAALGRDGTPADTAAAFHDVLAELNAVALHINPQARITLFCQNTDPPAFTQRVNRAKGLHDYGYDGNLAPQWRRGGEVGWFKYRVDSPTVRARFEAEAAAAGLKTFALIENMLMPANSHATYEQNLEAYLAGPLPAHLSVYYYGHDNEDPEGLHAITRRLMRRYFG